MKTSLRDAVIAAGPPPDALMDSTPAGQELRSWWLDRYAPVLEMARSLPEGQPRGTICVCGLAKTYHDGVAFPNLDHEYEPRYPRRRHDD